MARKAGEKGRREQRKAALPVSARAPLNMTVIAVLAVLVLILAYTAVLYYGSQPQLVSQGTGNRYCHDGDVMACAVGECSGSATCVDGVWGGCRWERVCLPGTTQICTDQLCPSGVKECNQCGTGYGPCGAPE